MNRAMARVIDARWVGVNRWQRPTPAALAILLLGALVPSAGSAFFEVGANASASGDCVGNDTGNDAGPEGALTFAAISGSADPESCPPPNPASGLSLGAGGVAWAYLRSGELSAYGQAEGAGSVLPPPNIAAGAGVARFLDVVTVAGPTASFFTTAQLRLHVEGTISGWGFVNATIVRSGAFPPQMTAGCVGTYASGCASSVVSPVGPFAFDLQLAIPVDSSSPSIALYVALSASAVNEGEADASSTATFSIELPEGFTFTSESGVLLAPEPSFSALAWAAFASLAACGRARGTIRRRPH